MSVIESYEELNTKFKENQQAMSDDYESESLDPRIQVSCLNDFWTFIQRNIVDCFALL